MLAWGVGWLAAAGAASARADACACESTTREDALRRASAVFEGRVTEIAPAPVGTDGAGGSALRVEIAVVRGWKGAERERLSVRTAGDPSACGYVFVRDESYLVYASERSGALWVDHCSRTRPVAQAGADLAAMGMGVTPVEVAAEQADDSAAANEPPGRGGCAGCRIGAAGSSGRGAVPALVALAFGCAALRRRRSRG